MISSVSHIHYLSIYYLFFLLRIPVHDSNGQYLDGLTDGICRKWSLRLLGHVEAMACVGAIINYNRYIDCNYVKSCISGYAFIVIHWISLARRELFV